MLSTSGIEVSESSVLSERVQANRLPSFRRERHVMVKPVVGRLLESGVGDIDPGRALNVDEVDGHSGLAGFRVGPPVVDDQWQSRVFGSAVLWSQLRFDLCLAAFGNARQFFKEGAGTGQFVDAQCIGIGMDPRGQCVGYAGKAALCGRQGLVGVGLSLLGGLSRLLGQLWVQRHKGFQPLNIEAEQLGGSLRFDFPGGEVGQDGDDLIGFGGHSGVGARGYGGSWWLMTKAF